jgi:hypothetical protein
MCARRTEDEKIRADYEASVSLLTEAEREKLWNDAKAFCEDWLADKIPRTPANSAKLKKQIDILTVDCDPDCLAELIDTITKAQAKSAAALTRNKSYYTLAGIVPMSAIGPKRTSLVAPHMSAFGGKWAAPPATRKRGPPPRTFQWQRLTTIVHALFCNRPQHFTNADK